MRRELQEQLIRRLAELIERDETTLVENERLNPVSEYFDPARLAAERSQVLLRYPIVVDHVSQVTPDSPVHLTSVSGTNLVTALETDSRLRVLKQDCGGEPVSLDSAVGTVVCPAHGMAYSARPDESHPAGPAGCLTEVPSEARHGFVWARVESEAAIDVAAYLGHEIDGELSDFRLGSYVVERTHVFTENINWKSVIDGFLENYHVRFLHANTLARFLRSNVHLYDPFGPHNRLAVIKTTFDKVRDLPVREYEPLKHMSVIYQVFPNTVVNWVGDHFESWTSFPDPARPRLSRTLFTLLVPPDRVSEHDFWDRSMKTILDTIPNEDFKMARIMQQGLLANAQTHQVFGRNEGALQHFHIELENVLGRAR